jgi:hypothetical protein
MRDSLQPPFGSREERVAYNESWARELNRARLEWQAGGGTIGFRCECARVDCDALIELTASEWADVRSEGNRFAVFPGHATGDVESVVAEDDRFWIVEKHGKAGEVAEKLAD